MAEAGTKTSTKLKRSSSRRRVRKLKLKGKLATSVAADPASGESAGSKTSHLSFRAPTSLIEAAKRESGIDSPTALGIAGLTMLAEPDPVVAFLKRTRGRLGEDAELEY
jgi:hypothetical protein